MKTYVKDYWLWSEIKICQNYCNECGSGDRVVIRKKDIPKLIKILKKLNYRGTPKMKTRQYYVTDKEYIVCNDVEIKAQKRQQQK